jgi:hypothetical protein
MSFALRFSVLGMLTGTSRSSFLSLRHREKYLLHGPFVTGKFDSHRIENFPPTLVASKVLLGLPYELHHGN